MSSSHWRSYLCEPEEFEFLTVQHKVATFSPKSKTKEEESKSAYTLIQASKIFSLVPFDTSGNLILCRLSWIKRWLSGLWREISVPFVGRIELIKGPMTAGKTTRMLEKYHRAVASLRTHRKLLSPVLIGYSKTANEPHQLSKFVKTLEGGTEWSQLKDNRGFVGTHGDIVYPCWTGNNLFNVFYRCLETKISEVRALLKGHENPSEILCNFEPALKEIIWSTTLPDTEDFADAMLLSYAATMIGVVGIDEGQFFGELKPFCQVLRYWGIKVYVSGLNADWTLNHWESIAELEAVCDDVTFLKAICVSCGSEEAVVSKKLITTSEDSKVREDIGGTDKYIPVCMKCYHNYAQ